MTAPTPGTAKVPPGVAIREQSLADSAEVHRVVAEAFGDPIVADLDVELARRPGGRAYVAATTEAVLGHVRLTWGWVDAPTQLVDVLILSPLSVATSWQRRGIGLALIDRAVRAADDLGAPLLFLEGDPSYYSRAGFVAAEPLGFGRPSVRIPGGAFQVMRLGAYQTWMTGALVYPEAFWAFDCVGLRETGDS